MLVTSPESRSLPIGPSVSWGIRVGKCIWISDDFWTGDNCEIPDPTNAMALPDHRSFAPVAGVLSLSQSTSTRRLQVLEPAFGASLFQPAKWPIFGTLTAHWFIGLHG
jgi:hypothetical protein